MNRQKTLATDERIKDFCDRLAQRGRNIPDIRALCLGERNFLKNAKYVKRGDDPKDKNALTTLALTTRHRIVTRYRNAIRERFGDKHPALDYMVISFAEQEERNAADRKSIKARHTARRAIHAEDHIGAALEILSQHPAHSPLKIAAALIAVTGRRPVEIFLTGDLKKVPTADPDLFGSDISKSGRWSVLFSGQAKTRNSENGTPYEIPVLVMPALVVEAFAAMRDRYGCQGMTAQQVGNRTSKELGKYAKALFADRDGEELNPSALRAAYATIAYDWFAPREHSWNAYTARILGHSLDDLITSFSYDQFYPIGSKRDYDRSILSATKETLSRLQAQRGREQNEVFRGYIDEKIHAVKERLK